MERFLDAYIERMKGHYRGFSPMTAHEIASGFLAFKFGLYEKAESECASAIALIPDSPDNSVLKKGLAIISAHAVSRNNSQVGTEVTLAFTEAEMSYLAIVIPDEKNEDPVTLELDNALILVYVVALITSPDDEDTLTEHRRTIVRILSDHKKALGLA